MTAKSPDGSKETNLWNKFLKREEDLEFQFEETCNLSLTMPFVGRCAYVWNIVENNITEKS